MKISYHFIICLIKSKQKHKLKSISSYNFLNYYSSLFPKISVYILYIYHIYYTNRTIIMTIFNIGKCNKFAYIISVISYKKIHYHKMCNY